MDRARRVSTFFIASLLILGGLLHLSIDHTMAGGSTADIKAGTRAATIPVEAGTEIKIEPGKVVNGDHYYPVPIGSTVLSADITYSNIPYTSGETDYSQEAWFNIGNAPKEYTFGVPGEWMYGFWGWQNHTRTGEDEIDITLDGNNPSGGRFVLPKNATITSATFNITGFQRPDEYQHWYFEGFSLGDMVGYVVRDVGNNYVGMGAPGESSNSGSFYIIHDSQEGIMVSFITSGNGRMSELGYSISNPFKISGSSRNKIAVGGPGYGSNKGYIEIMDVSTSYSSYQILQGNNSGDRFGEAIGAGDINGDGKEELIVGAPSTNNQNGTIFIFHQIINTSANNRSEFDLLTVLNGSSSDTNFGKSIAVGDINADKIEDIVVASNEDVYVFHGSSTFDTTYDKNFDPLTTYKSQIQNLKFLGPLSSSSAESLGIGLPNIQGGNAVIYHGGATYDTAEDVVFSPPSGKMLSNFGWDIDAGYDFDDDGIPEVAIGAPGGGMTLTSGWTGIYSITNTKTPLDEFTTSDLTDAYGSSVAFGTDLGLDGYGDLVVGAPNAQDVLGQRVGRTYIHERLGTSVIPPNTPVVYIEGTEAWRYTEEHLPIGTTITTGDLSSAINSYLETATVAINSQHEGFAYVDIEIDMADFSSMHHSNHFLIDGFEIIYNIQRETGDVADAFNSFMEVAPEDAKDLEKGIIKVPFKYGGLTEGGIRIDSIEIEFDLVPEIAGNLPLLHIEEDSHITNLLDVYLIFDDDYTSDEELNYLVFASGENSSKFKPYLVDERYVAIDMVNGTESYNWSGFIEINLAAIDESGGRTTTDNIRIQVDPVNDAPAIGPLPDETIVQNARLQYFPRARDAEGDDILYLLKEGHHPENMTVDQVGGTVLFEPNGWQTGEQYWILILDDGQDQREYNFSLEVINVNDAPIFETPVPMGLEVLVGETLSIQFYAYDLDPSDIIRYSLPEGPIGSSIGFESGLLTWKPYIYLEGPQKFKVRAMDLENAYTDLEFYVNVTFIDLSPIINSTPVTSLTDLLEWTYQVLVTDPENDIIFVELVDGPEGMEYDDEYTDSLIWTPSPSQLGTFDISLMITSTTYTIYHNFTLSVTRTERDWSLELDRSLDGLKVSGKVTIGGTASVSPSTVDSIYITIGDEPPIRLLLEGEGWSYTIETNDFDNGELVIKITASDGIENSTAETLTLMVSNEKGGAPILLIILIIILLVIIIAVGVFGFLLYNRMQKKKEEEEDKKMKLEDLQRSKQDISQFIQSADYVEGDTTAFDQVQTSDIDQGRMDAIDEVFAPMQPGEVAEGTYLESDEIPEDILQKASIQESVIGSDPPEITEDLENLGETGKSVDEENMDEDEIPPPPSMPPMDQ